MEAAECCCFRWGGDGGGPPPPLPVSKSCTGSFRLPSLSGLEDTPPPLVAGTCLGFPPGGFGRGFALGAPPPAACMGVGTGLGSCVPGGVGLLAPSSAHDGCPRCLLSPETLRLLGRGASVKARSCPSVRRQQTLHPWQPDAVQRRNGSSVLSSEERACARLRSSSKATHLRRFRCCRLILPMKPHPTRARRRRSAVLVPWA